MKMSLLFIAICIALSQLMTFSSAEAYVPPYWMIMSKTADKHGRGPYVLEQDVQFNINGETLVATETWYVLNENSMRVEVQGRGLLRDKLRLVYVYSDNKKYFIDESGVKKVEKIPSGFIEHFFHFRFSKNIKSDLVELKIAPAVSLKSEPHRYSTKRPRPEPESYIRLSRAGGVVTYAIGSPTPVSSAIQYPGLWIEQDNFTIRKLRLPSQIEVSADNYKSFNNNFNFPGERAVRFDNQEAKIILKSAATYLQSDKLKTLLDSDKLNYGQDPSLARLLATDDSIIKFYQKLR